MSQDVEKGWRSCFRNDLLSGKVALVTGEGAGIGRAIATELACVGATVIISSRNVSQCEETTKLINDFILEEQSKLNCGATGKFYAGPSTSIRSEEEIEILVCYHNRGKNVTVACVLSSLLSFALIEIITRMDVNEIKFVPITDELNFGDSSAIGASTDNDKVNNLERDMDEMLNNLVEMFLNEYNVLVKEAVAGLSRGPLKEKLNEFF